MPSRGTGPPLIISDSGPDYTQLVLAMEIAGRQELGRAATSNVPRRGVPVPEPAPEHEPELPAGPQPEDVDALNYQDAELGVAGAHALRMAAGNGEASERLRKAEAQVRRAEQELAKAERRIVVAGEASLQASFAIAARKTWKTELIRAQNAYRKLSVQLRPDIEAEEEKERRANLLHEECLDVADDRRSTLVRRLTAEQRAYLPPMPTDTRAREAWLEEAISIEAYRQEHNIVDPTLPFGQQPENAFQVHEWVQRHVAHSLTLPGENPRVLAGQPEQALGMSAGRQHGGVERGGGRDAAGGRESAGGGIER